MRHGVVDDEGVDLEMGSLLVARLQRAQTQLNSSLKGAHAVPEGRISLGDVCAEGSCGVFYVVHSLFGRDERY